VIGTDAICYGFDHTCIEQALNSRSAHGVTDLVFNLELFQFRYLQTFQEVGANVGNTLVLGLTDNERLNAAARA
jgi:hypothetical protein